jgi:hypothetical protein
MAGIAISATEANIRINAVVAVAFSVFLGKCIFLFSLRFMRNSRKSFAEIMYPSRSAFKSCLSLGLQVETRTYSSMILLHVRTIEQELSRAAMQKHDCVGKSIFVFVQWFLPLSLDVNRFCFGLFSLLLFCDGACQTLSTIDKI